MKTIGLLAAVRQELVAVVRMLDLTAAHGIHIGTVGPHRVVAMVSGMGAYRAEIAFDDLVATWGPTAMLHVGFAGGLDPALEAGAIPAATCVFSTEREPTLRLGAEGPPHRAEPGAETDGTALLSTGALVTTPDEKRSLYAKTGAATVDMESYALARRAAQSGVRLRIFRAVVDTASMALAPAVRHWVDDRGRTRWARLARDAAMQPALLPAAVTLGRHARRAGTALATAVGEALDLE